MFQNLENIKRKSIRRVKSALFGTGSLGRPVFSSSMPKYEVNSRISVSQYGGIPTIKTMVQEIGLTSHIDNSLSLLSYYRPYHESDHVLNIAFSALCGGENLQDIETLRNDPCYLDSLAVKMIPDPTTAGDFCRRFQAKDLSDLQDAINETRKGVWQTHAGTQDAFFNEARIDVDGVLVNTTGECKEGMDINYKGGWGYHPLVVSLANTAESLFIVNRPGNVASHHNSADWIEASVKVCKEAGFRKVRVRGDSDFSLTANFDRWDKNFKFVFSYDAMPNLKRMASALEEDPLYYAEEKARWDELIRQSEQAIQRNRPKNVKEEMVVLRGFEQMKLIGECIAEFDYQPVKCSNTYRMIAVRKEIEHRKHGELLFPEYRYFFYITNDHEASAKDLVKEAGERCNQENTVNQQLQNGCYALKAPLDNLESNAAWMICAALSWNLKAWAGLLLPIHPSWRKKHEEEQQKILKIEMKRFVRDYIQIPVQVVKHARKIVLKISAYREGTTQMMRLHQALE